MDNAEKKIWPERCPEAIADNRIEFIPLDFLKGSPKEGCDIYYVRLLKDSESIALLIINPAEKYFVRAFQRDHWLETLHLSLDTAGQTKIASKL